MPASKQKTEPELHIEYVRLDTLKRAPRNPQGHDLPEIGQAFSRFGYIDPIVIDEKTGAMVAGHGRVETLEEQKARGDAPPRRIKVDDDGEWLAPVLRGVDFENDAEAEAYLLAANRITRLGVDDDAMLAEMLTDLTQGPGLPGTGFDDADLAALLASTDDPGGRILGDPDIEIEPPPDPVTKIGDVWVLGDHRLICADAAVPANVERIVTEPVDMILTDPPYCSGGFQESGKPQGSVGTTSTHKQVANDRLSTRGYMALLKSAFAQVPAPFLYAFTDWRMWTNLFDVVESSGYGVRSMIVWDKGSPGMGMGWRAQHELVMFGAKETPKFDNHAAHGNVIQSQRTGNLLHTTQKPVDLLVELLDVAAFAQTIYDPFAGSGSTLIAAHESGRVTRLAEMDPGYCDVICERFERATGIVPRREDGTEVSFITEGA